MDTMISKTARVFGVPEEVVDAIGRDFILNLAEELPPLFLPAFMSELKRLLSMHGPDWIKRNVIHLQVYFAQLRHMDEPQEAEPGRIEALIESVAAQYRVSVDVLNLVGMEFISQVISEFPNLLLSPIMQTLKHEQVQHGLDWLRQNVASVREELLLLKRLYGPTWILA